LRALVTTLALAFALPLAPPGGRLAAGASAAPSAKSFAALRRAGQRAYRARKFEKAAALFRASSSLRPDDGEVWLDLAMCLQHLSKADDAIAANREAIRLASRNDVAGSPRARRARRAAYFNLGKLAAARKLDFPDDAATCAPLPSDLGCREIVFACGRTGAMGTADGHQDSTAARFSLDEPTARADDEGGVERVLDTWPDLGRSAESTKDAEGGWSYDVTLSLDSRSRQTIDGEPGVEVGSEEAACSVVHVDGCAGRLGLYCAWRSSRVGAKDESSEAAVELTFKCQTDTERRPVVRAPAPRR